MLVNVERVQRWCFPRSTQTTLIGPLPIYIAIWRQFGGRHIWLFSGHRNLISLWCTSILALSLAEKMWQCFVTTTFNLTIRFTAVEADSHLTASMITCKWNAYQQLFRYCNIHSISVQINKYSFKCKEWSQLFLLFSWVLFQIENWRSFCCKQIPRWNE